MAVQTKLNTIAPTGDVDALRRELNVVLGQISASLRGVNNAANAAVAASTQTPIQTNPNPQLPATGIQFQPGSISQTAHDIETGAVTLTRNSFIIIAKIASFNALQPNDVLRFVLTSNLSLTSFLLSQDSIKLEVVQDTASGVGSAVVGGTVIIGPSTVQPNVASGPSSNPIVGASYSQNFVIPDTAQHSYSVAVEIATAGTSLTGSTVAGTTATPSASLDIYEIAR